MKQFTMKVSCQVFLRLIKHWSSVTFLMGFIYLSSLVPRGVSDSDFSAIDRYGLFLTGLLYLMQYAVITSLPFSIFNFLGVVFINVFVQKPKLQHLPVLAPFLCFRVVTRGMYPNLVSENVKYNLEICRKRGLTNYVIEVVTDEPIKLQANCRIREVVVPSNYATVNNTIFKARALQYAIQPDVNILGPGDWIVHLDEETLLTEDAVTGILNFVASGKHHFGQGAITYGKGSVVNWMTTLAESLRVGIDYGCYRFTLGVLHKPVFSWKGSFIVANFQAEIDVSFDYGPEGSIAEDCFFSCVAFSKGYSFGFVEGEMLENSTFNLHDFVKQRSRWMRGIFLTTLSRQIPLQFKIGPTLLTVSNIVMPINLLLLPIGVVLPLPMSPVLLCVYSFILGTFTHLYVLGTFVTFCLEKENNCLKCCLLLLATLPCGLLACLLENVSSLLVFWTPQTSMYSFYIVSKENTSIRNNFTSQRL